MSDLLKLYKDGKIFSKIAVQKELNSYLGQSFNNEQARDLQYYKTMVKYLDAPSATDKRRDKRMEEQRGDIEKLFEIAERRTTSRYTIKAILYSLTPRDSQKKWKNGDQVLEYCNVN